MTNTSHTIPSAEPHAADEGHGGIGKYIAVFVALCLLTSASFFTYSSYWPFHATPSIGWAFMMAVSCTKAMLVILFFMHLLWEANWKYVLTVPALFMSIFLICMLIPDVGLRQRNYSEERRSFAAEVMPPMTHADHGDHDVEHAAEHPSNDEGHH